MIIWTVSIYKQIWTVSILKKTASYHHGNLRQELIAAAFKLLDKNGIEGVGVRQIAREVGVAHSAPANHFKNKQTLYTVLAAESFAELLEILKKQLGPELDVEASVHVFCQCLLDFALAYPHRYSLMWRKDCLDAEDAELASAMEAVYQLLLSALAGQAKRKGVDVESQAIAVWSLIHGYVSLRLDGNLEKGNDAVTGADRATAIVNVMLEGLR